MARVKLNDKEFETYYSFNELQIAIENLANVMVNDLSGKNPLFLGVLNGSFRFASDLLSKLEINCEISFVKVASYRGTESTGTVRQLIGLDENLKGRTVVIVEDIVDRGHTVENVVELVKHYHPADIKICTCLFKPSAYEKDIPIDYAAIEIDNDFVVGYGLDYDGLGRNLNDLYKIIE